MANGTIAFDTLSDKWIQRIRGTAKTLDTSYIFNGVSKAWVNLQGTDACAIRDSFNLTSATDNGTGDYTLTIANDMGNTTYSCSIVQQVIHLLARYNIISDSDGKATGTAGFFGFQTNTGSALDPAEMSTSLLGDLSMTIKTPEFQGTHLWNRLRLGKRKLRTI